MEVDKTGSDDTGRHPMWGPVQLHPLSYPNVNIDYNYHAITPFVLS